VLFAEVPEAPPSTGGWTGPVPEVRMPPGYWAPTPAAELPGGRGVSGRGWRQQTRPTACRTPCP